MDGQPDELLRQLGALDTQFPTGLKDRPYELPDLIWNGPFYGKGGPQVIRNPITNTPTPMHPLASPEHYLSAINTMVEAKANARANVLRGWNADQASAQALSKAWGVDPSMVAGQDPKTAQGVIQGQAAGRREDFQNQQEERRTRQGDQELQMRQRQFEGQMEDRAGAMSEKEGRQRELSSALEGLPRAQEYLNGLPADKAFQLAPGILAPLAKAGSPIYEGAMNSIATRANREAMQADADAKDRDEHIKRIGAKAKDLDAQFKPLFDELRKVAPVKYADVTEDVAGIPTKKREAQYDNAFEDRLASIMGVINNVSSFDPALGQSLGTLEALRDNPDKREALGKLNTVARALEQRVREILGEQKAALQPAGD